MNVTDLNIEIGTKINLYIQQYKDGSGSCMGPGVEGKPEYLTEVIWHGPIYSGVMGQVSYINGKNVGLPISAESIIIANPNLSIF
jgi:hypothetical protein